MEDGRNFKGVWIPKEIWLCKDLTPLEKFYLIEIDSLDDEKEGCFASNKHFEEIFGQKGSNISRIIENLRLKGWINVEYIYKGKEIEKRVIKINRPPFPSRYVKNEYRYVKNDKEVCYKLADGYVKNDKGSITILDKQLDNNNIYSRVIDYLNLKAGTSYKPTTKNTQRHINARISEGYKLEDFYKVIDNKCSEWLNTSMQKYLRPETLFGTKFESYLNQKQEKTIKDMLDEILWEDKK